MPEWNVLGWPVLPLFRSRGVSVAESCSPHTNWEGEAAPALLRVVPGEPRVMGRCIGMEACLGHHLHCCFASKDVDCFSAWVWGRLHGRAPCLMAPCLGDPGGSSSRALGVSSGLGPHQGDAVVHGSGVPISGHNQGVN